MKFRIGCVVALMMAFACGAAEPELERAKVELLVDQASELYQDACRRGSPTHTPAHIYYYGMMYGVGTNLLARAQTTSTKILLRQYMSRIEKDYDAYTRYEDAMGMAAATGTRRGKAGGRSRAKRIANAEKLGEKELGDAIRRWENFVHQVKVTR